MKTKFVSCAFAIAALTPSFAFAVETPVIDTLPDAVDAGTLKISGTAEAGAKITLTGGTAEIAPVIADNAGRFSIKVGLVQEALNSIPITASLNDETSPAVTIEIVEGKEAARAYGEANGVDVIAPDSVELDPYTAPLNADIILLSGTAEAGATVSVSSPDDTIIVEKKVDEDGRFAVCIPLSQNAKNRLNFSIKDDSGNISSMVQEVIEESDTATQVLIDTEQCNEKKDTNEFKGYEFETTVDIAPPFTDITGHWAATYIDKLRLKKILTGRKPGLFMPDDTVTRAELVKIALKAFDYKLYSPEISPFSDVDLYLWYTPYISKALDLQLVQGYGENLFAPDKQISRVEALKILLMSAGFNISAQFSSLIFPDVENDAWYSKYLAFALENRIVNGYSDGTFKPNAPVTRAEISKMAFLLLELRDSSPPSSSHNESSPSLESPRSFSVHDLSEKTQRYVNSFYKFTFSFDSNWFYNWPGGINGDIATVYLSDKNTEDEDFSEQDNLITISIKKKSLSEIGILEGAEVEENNIFSTYAAFDEDSHIEISGNAVFKAEIQRIASTLEIDINPDDFSQEEETIEVVVPEEPVEILNIE